MAKSKKQSLPRKTGSGLLIKLLLLLLLAGLGWQLVRTQAEVREAQGALTDISSQVAAREQENAALEQDIAEGGSEEKMKDIARESLGMVEAGEKVFYDVSG